MLGLEGSLGFVESFVRLRNCVDCDCREGWILVAGWAANCRVMRGVAEREARSRRELAMRVEDIVIVR